MHLLATGVIVINAILFTGNDKEQKEEWEENSAS